MGCLARPLQGVARAEHQAHHGPSVEEGPVGLELDGVESLHAGSELNQELFRERP